MKSIYLTDDDPVPIRVLKMTLEREGFKVESFPNGSKGARSHPGTGTPDVLITDIEMPVMTGEELCKQIGVEFPERAFAIFVVTSLPERAHRDWAHRMQNLTFVEKPLSMRRLLMQLNEVLSVESRRD